MNDIFYALYNKKRFVETHFIACRILSLKNTNNDIYICESLGLKTKVYLKKINKLYDNGTYEYFVLHRDDELPAFESDNTTLYVVNGVLHSLKYPAEKVNNKELYFIQGIEYSKTEWFIEKARLLIESH